MKLFDLDEFFGKRGVYKEPKKDEIDNLKELIDVLILQNENTFNLNNFSISAKKLNLKITELEDKPGNYAFYDDSSGPLFFIFNFNEVNSGSCLVYPHAGSDSIDNFVLNQYLSGNHKMLLINGWSIASTNKKSLTQPSKTMCNIDHSYDNLANYLIHFINLRMPELVFINMHGMITNPDRNMWIINSMANYDYSIRNYPILLLIAFLLYYPEIKIQTNINLDRFTLNGKPMRLQGFERSGPVSSVVGRIIHSSSIDLKDPVTDTGNFVHSEHSIGFVSKINNSNKISDSHSRALVYYKTWNSSHSLDKAPNELKDFEKWLFQ